MRNSVFFLFLFTNFAFAAQHSRTAEFILHSRTVEFKNISQQAIAELRQKAPQIFKHQFTYADLDEALQVVMATGQFEDVSIESDSDETTEKITFTGRPLRRILGFQIEGNNQLSRSDIREALSLQEGDIFMRKRLVDGAERLKQRYGEMGYLNASIEIDFEVKDQNIVIKVRIQEGLPCLIKDVIVDTPNKALQASLIRRIARNLGRPLTEQRVTQMREIIESYFSTNRYLSAQLSPVQVDYNDEKTFAFISLKIENPYRFELIFDGNRALTSPTLLRNLELENYPRTTLNPALDINNKLGDLYHDRGYAFVQIDYREKVFDKLFLKRVYYKIKESKRVKIASIEIVGRISREPEFYASFITDNSTELVSQGYYHRQGLDLGLKNMQIELQNQGYLKAKVSTVRTNFSDDKQQAFVSVNLDEGPRTKVQDIQFKGNNVFSADQLRREIKLAPNEPLRLPDLEASIFALKSFYQTHGYLEMSLRNENQDVVQYNADNSAATILFDINEGPQIRVSRVVIEGNQLTKDYVILREIDFAPGDILTPEHIAESTGRLQRLGLFSQVTIGTLEQGTPIANRTAVISVVEGNPGLFNPGIGFTDEANLTYRGFLGLTYRNIAGTARAFSSRVELNYASDPRISFLENKVQLAYYEPFVFNTRNRARIAYTHAQFVNTYNLDEGTVGIQQSDDVRLFLERDLSLHTKLTWTVYGLERSHFYEKNNRTPEEDRFIATIGPTLDIDYRDNPFNPMSGSFTRLSTEYSDPVLGSDDTIRYIKSDAQFTKYYKLLKSGRLVWANQVRGGFLNNISTMENSGIPYEKAFFLGGRSTIRGFEPAAERFPEAQELNYTNNPNFDITHFIMPSRSQYFLVKTELRFPIYGNFGGAIFYDGGAVYIDGLPLEDPYRDSVGAGLRFSTPVGPVNLEAGYKLDRKTKYKETPYRIHFSIGTF